MWRFAGLALSAANWRRRVGKQGAFAVAFRIATAFSPSYDPWERFGLAAREPSPHARPFRYSSLPDVRTIRKSISSPLISFLAKVSLLSARLVLVCDATRTSPREKEHRHEGHTLSEDDPMAEPQAEIP